jgi:alkylhydroperoxidase family enzyme
MRFHERMMARAVDDHGRRATLGLGNRLPREESPMADKQRISYVALEDMTPEMRAEMERCAREGTPRPESSAIRAHVPAAFWFFANSWNDLFRNGILDHDVKELCRVYISRSVKCEYCGNQRSEKGRSLGLEEGQYDELLNFEDAAAFTDRQKAALAYAEAVAWHLDTDDEFWARMYAHFNEAELVELGCMIGLTLGQQSWLRLLNIEHHKILAGTDASMAPGFETADALAQSKASDQYWARPSHA